MNKTLLTSAALFCLGTSLGLSAPSAPDAGALSLLNEDGSLALTLQLDARGSLEYRLDRLDGGASQAVIETSPLGLSRTDTDFSRDLSFVSATDVSDVVEDYTLIAGKFSHVKSKALERSFTFKNKKGVAVTLCARLFRDGLAFRYGFPGKGSPLLEITGEQTGFKLPSASRVWAQPYSKVDVWAPGYEANYVNGVPAGTASPNPEGWALPLLAKSAQGWILITESGLESSYCGVHLEQKADGGLYRVRFPEEPETYGVARSNPMISLPWESPWRVIIVGRATADIIQSTLVTDVARPSEQSDSSWIKPGVASWSWMTDMGSPYNYPQLLPFVDISAQLEWSYSLIDLGWHEMQGGNIKKLVDYAASKNVGLIVWYNSAGKHNQVPDAGPRDRMDDPLIRDAEMARIAAMGIKGIKVDFMQSDKQYVIALYHDIMRDAARHRLLVNFHGATIPRGWQRTYPNLVTMEAVRGNEQCWEQAFVDQAHTTNTIYAFTRNAIGPMDFTPVILTDLAPRNPQIKAHKTTYAHELALLVVFDSGIQHVCDSAESLASQPAYVKDYLRGIPTAWDETKLLAGSPGELAVFARRKADRWYLGGINGKNEPVTVRLPLGFLPAGSFASSLLIDGAEPREIVHKPGRLGSADVLEITLAGRGGFAAKLMPATENASGAQK